MYFQIYISSYFFIYCLAVRGPISEPFSRAQPHSPDINHYVIQVRHEGHQEPRKEYGSLRPAEHQMGLEAEPSHFITKP